MQKGTWIHHACRAFSVALFLFIAGSGNAVAYGGYQLGYGYHDYGYHGHYGFSAHYSSHGDIGTAGYVILGLFGAVLLSHILSSDDYRYRGVYHRSPAYQPAYQRIAKPVTYIPYRGPDYSYGSHEGWDALTERNISKAIDIFAVQSQQDLYSGIPRVGFAIAAAANGELDRGISAMRKAVSMDPAAMNYIQLNKELDEMIYFMNEDYKLALQDNESQFDLSFMVAALSYLQRDYATANDALAESDRSQSADNLRKLLIK
ncbi:MAG: hypothetical protein HY356_08970 [Gammaproteobacteria bacterium]|nr:hypothetical protein [Gammaproteobacteria bacterium]